MDVTTSGTVGVRELKAHLSSYLERVAGGEAWVVTDRGQPVARLVPVGAEMTTLNQLVDAGLVTRPGRTKAPASAPIAVGGTVSDLVAEQRR